MNNHTAFRILQIITYVYSFVLATGIVVALISTRWKLALIGLPIALLAFSTAWFIRNELNR
jgi:hypothetical protein